MAAETSVHRPLAYALRRAMEGTVGKRNPKPAVLDEARQAALDAAKALSSGGSKFDAKVYDELDDDLPADLRAWLLELPSFLSKKGRHAQGEELCTIYAPILGEPYLDAERAVVTWESGEPGAKEKGRQELDAARAKHPSHCWPELRTAYVLEQESRLDDAQKHYEAAVEKARASGEKKDLRFSWDGLVQFHHGKGDRAKALELSRQMLEECPDLEEELRVETIVNEKPKTGRNDPCPCGSGKKAKKCCGAA
jgi:uncharacterized protein YchJ